ncbi:hypothetical protein F4815DRAFT_448317 [Daldinia loculata]|nr:hypothetical protein F4815DRAFT_448317 [Daldinia loculata]
MKPIFIVLALSSTAMAAPLGRILSMVKRVPDVDREVTEAGFIAVPTNALWSVPDEEDISSIDESD